MEKLIVQEINLSKIAILGKRYRFNFHFATPYLIHEYIDSRCESSPSTPGCMEVLCETQLCLLDESAVRQLESTPYLSWKPARNYSSFWGKTLDEGLSMKLGTFKPEQPVSSRVSITINRLNVNTNR